MPHVSLWDKVIIDLITFISRAMAQLTHLHLSVLSSGTTTGTVPPECFPVVLLPRKPRRVFFASDVEVMMHTSFLPFPGVEPDSLDRPLPSRASLLPSVPDADANHGQNVFVIVPPGYELFPCADPFDDEDVLLMPRFPSLPAPPGFYPIDT